MLAAAPSRIAQSTDGLTEAQLHDAPLPGEWSANEVLAHLRSCGDIWGGYMMTILDQDKTRIRAINPRTWIKSTDYPVQKFRPSLRSFTTQRAELLNVLESLKPRAWLRTAIVTGAGKPLELSVLSYAQRMAVHERPHLKQIQRIAGMMEK
jgi:hypothetical protein